MIVGKSGRADTPTDPSPLDMVETIINLRPQEFWPKRKMTYEDAQRQTKVVLKLLEDKGYFRASTRDSDRQAIINRATMAATSRLDATLREFALQRYHEFQQQLGPRLVREFVAELTGRWQQAGRLLRPVEPADVDRVAGELDGEFAARLAAGPAQEDINRLVQKIAEGFAARKTVDLNPDLLTLKLNPVHDALLEVAGVLGVERPSLFTAMRDFIEHRRDALWRQRGNKLDYEMFDQAVGATNWYCLEELRQEAQHNGLWSGPTDAAGVSDVGAAQRNSPLPLGEWPGVRAAV